MSQNDVYNWTLDAGVAVTEIPLEHLPVRDGSGPLSDCMSFASICQMNVATSSPARRASSPSPHGHREQDGVVVTVAVKRREDRLAEGFWITRCHGADRCDQCGHSFVE